MFWTGNSFRLQGEVCWDVPTAAGAYRPEAFTDSSHGERIEWGVHIGRQRGFLPFIERFELVEDDSADEENP